MCVGEHMKDSKGLIMNVIIMTYVIFTIRVLTIFLTKNKRNKITT